MVEAENPITGLRTHTNTAYLVYVAVDEHGRPVTVPPLLPEDAAQQARMEAGRDRQAYRLEQNRLSEKTSS
jgi:acyl-CoA hydrolase